MSIILLIFGLLAFVGLVVVHEFGHFIAARRSGVDVEEFGIGFPPKAMTMTKKKGTEFTLNWLPLGGFVKLKGEHDDDEEKGSFGATSLRNKVKIMVAGVGMNLITALILFTIVALMGMPKLVDNQFTVASDTKVSSQALYVGAVIEDSPAKTAGIAERDKLLTITEASGKTYEVKSAEELPKVTKSLNGQDVKVTFLREGQEKTADVKLLSSEEVEASKNTDSPKGYLGIVPTEFVQQRSTWSAPVVALGVTKQFTELTLKGIGSALSGLFTGDTKKASEQVSGPVGIFVVLKDGSTLGASFVLMIIAVISLTLAIMNILPIPALDGGRLFVTLLYRARGKRLKPSTEDRIHGTGMAVLLTLFVLITIVDVKRFF